MEPKVYEHKTLNYQGNTIFSKIVMGEFDRIEKYFQKDEACFMFIENGGFLMRTPNKTIQFSSGEGLFAKCGNYFFEKKQIKPLSEIKTTLIAAYFYPEIITKLFDEDITTFKYQTPYDAKKIIIDQFLSNFKESISLLLDHPELVDEPLILTKLKEFIILLAKTDNAPSVIEFVSSFFKPVEYTFKSIIERNVFSSLSIDEFARLCGMSLATFKRKFKDYYSTSPKKHFIRIKIDKAKQMLLIQENRIVDIAYDCGFDTVSSFNRNFKSQTGISPSEYRKTPIEPN